MKVKLWSRIVTWLFGPSLETLIAIARTRGEISLQSEAGAGYYFTIRPPSEDTWPSSSLDPELKRKRRINVWSGRKPTVRGAVLEAIEEAETMPFSNFDRTPCVPKLGGPEFDE